jgi:hypothetical protein
MSYTKGPSAPSSSELEAFNKIFDDNLIASNVEALDALFPDGVKGPSRQAQGHLLGHTATSVLVVLYIF